MSSTSTQEAEMPPSLRYAGESYTEKATRKFKENPWVPLGAIATTAAFSMAAVRMRQGEAKSFNIWLRWRIIFQGLTIAAVCAGTYNFGLRSGTAAEEQKKKEIEDERRRREEKLRRDREEFEARVRAATEEHEAEASFARAMGERRKEREAAAGGPPRMSTEAEKHAREKEVRRLLANRATGSSTRSPAETSMPETTPEPAASEQKSKGWFGGWF